MRKDFSPSEVSTGEFYRLLTAVVVPRPIAWVSTRSTAGVDNLAPHSFFTVASVRPPIVQFTSVGEKDSLRNVQATKEFVVNLAPARLFEEVNATGTDFPPETSEFLAAGLATEESLTVRVPRVAESPVALECKLHTTLPIGDCNLVLGEVTHAALAEQVMDGNHPAISRLEPLSRLGRDEWGTLGAIQEIKRIRAREWPGHFQPGNLRC